MQFNPALDPTVHLDQWIQAAKDTGLTDPNAMTLATVGPNLQPSSRVVLYKGLVCGGLSFYTNFGGQKAQEIEYNSKVAVNFFWASLARQIRVQGEIAKLTRAESEAYFKTRSRLSQLGAWASQQSQEVSSLQALTDRMKEIEESFKGQEVPCPPHWGGLHLIPNYFEFWIGREGRLHERYCYEKQDRDWRRFMRFP